MEVSDFMRDVVQRLTSVEILLKTYCETRDREIKEIKANVCDHETRLRPVEHTRTRVLVLVSIISFFASILSGGLFKFVLWIFSGRGGGI